MQGLIIRYLGKEYKITSSIISSLVIRQNEFILEGGGYISSFQKIRDGIEFEVEVADFGQPTELITESNDFSEIGPEYTKMVQERSEEWDLNRKLEMYYRIEDILKEEGYLKE